MLEVTECVYLQITKTNKYQLLPGLGVYWKCFKGVLTGNTLSFICLVVKDSVAPEKGRRDKTYNADSLLGKQKDIISKVHFFRLLY